jgi:hypothetical protein
MFEYPKLFKKEGELILDSDVKSNITVVIINNGSEEEFFINLENYIKNLS